MFKASLLTFFMVAAPMVPEPLLAEPEPEPSLKASVEQLKAVSALDVAVRYGEEQERVFDIFRKGKRIGQSITRFDRTGDQLRVSTDMQLKVKVLFFTAYKLRYTSEEVWGDDGLITVLSDINDNGRDIDVTAQWQKDHYRIEGLEGFAPEEEDFDLTYLFPTNHWNAAALVQEELFNTLTGELLPVSTQSAGWESLQTANGMIRAERFVYSWDLDETESWYDSQGRWVGLRFSAKDGSKITYVCRNCGEKTT